MALEIVEFTLPVKGNQPKLCDSCIHKCVFKDITLCNIDLNPSLFYYNTKNNPIKECKDYKFAEDAYPKINFHTIWDWCAGFVFPTPVIVACKHEVPEFEQNSINELYPHCKNICKQYNIKLKGFPWVINLAETRLDECGIKIYRTNIISEAEINNILKNINQ